MGPGPRPVRSDPSAAADLKCDIGLCYPLSVPYPASVSLPVPAALVISVVRCDVYFLRARLLRGHPPPVYVMRAFLFLLRLGALLLQLLSLELRPSVLKPNFYLSFCEAKAVCELLPLGSDNVMVFLKGVLQPQQLRRGESRSDPFGFSGQRVVQKETLWTRFISLKPVAQISVSV